MEGAESIINNWQINIPESHTTKFLGEFVEDSLYGISSKLKTSGKYPVLRMNNLDEKGNWRLSDLKYIDSAIPKHRRLQKGDIIFNRTNSVELVGKSAVVDFDFDGTYAGYLIRLRLSNGLNPFYLRYLFACLRYRKLFSSIAKPAGGQANINANELKNVKIDYYEPEEQEKIVSKLDREMQSLNSVNEIAVNSKSYMDNLIESLWGQEDV